MTAFEAPIQEVTVYSDRALVTRQGRQHLEAGEHELHVDNLPQFIRDSLRAAGRGPQGTRILNVDVTTTFLSRPPEAELQKLEDELAQLEQQRQLLKARQDALRDRRQWLRALGEQSKDFAKGLAQGQMKPTDCADFFGFMASQALQDAELAQALDLELKQLEREIAAKQRELNQKQGHAHPDRLTALVVVEMTQAGDFELELSYLVMDASWYPQYDVRVQIDEENPNEGVVEVSYLGIVSQFTGEPWEQVELSLSTARPSLAAVLPELDPWYLNVYTPPPVMPPAPMISRALPKMAAPGAAASDIVLTAQTFAGGVREEMEVAHVATAQVEHTGTAYVFHVGRSSDIPSDNTPHKTMIANDSLPCKFDYVSAPAIEEYAHLRATITNTTEQALLDGSASIFLSGEYVGTTQIKLTAPSEKFEVFLGIDDGIKVKRELLERNVDKGNLLQNDLRRITYAYRITLHNYTAHPRAVVLRDHLPVPQHERVKVRVQQIQPAPAERTKLEIITWKFTLAPEGEQQVEYRFVVEHPQNLNVIGLPVS